MGCYPRCHCYTWWSVGGIEYYYVDICRNCHAASVNVFADLYAQPFPPTVSLDLLATDVRQLAKGMKGATSELVQNKTNDVLKDFCLDAEPKVTKLQEDLETAKVRTDEFAPYCTVAF